MSHGQPLLGDLHALLSERRVHLDEVLARSVDRITGYHTRSLLGAPVTDADGRVVAVIELLNRQDGPFDAADEARLTTLATEVAELLSASNLGPQLHPGLILSDRARAVLHAHGWPGNVRELLHTVEAAVVMCPGERIRPEHLPDGLGGATTPRPHDPRLFQTRPRTLREVEADYIDHVLALNRGNRTATARQLGVSRSTLLRRLGRREEE